MSKFDLWASVGRPHMVDKCMIISTSKLMGIWLVRPIFEVVPSRQSW